MSELKLTPARIELLRSVAAGEVVLYPSWGRTESRSINRATNKHVTGAMWRFLDAGLAKLPRRRVGDYSTQTWQLTPAGQTALEGIA
jgi:hypothetical protein